MGDTLIESGVGDPGRGPYRVERHEVDVDTDGSGDGSSTLTYDEAYSDGDSVTVHVTATADGDVYASAQGGTEATVNVAGSTTTEDTVTVNVLVIGAA